MSFLMLAGSLRKMTFFTYLLRCSDGKLYCGYTVHLAKRVKMHQAGRASKFTRARLPVKLVYAEKYRDKSSAMRREAEIKTFSRKKKWGLISDMRF